MVSERVNILNKTTEVPVQTAEFILEEPTVRVSHGGLDKINLEDVVHGECSSGLSEQGEWIDLVYLDDNVLRTFSGAVIPNHPVLEELKVLLRNDKKFYVVPIREVAVGVAFKRTDIINIRIESLIKATANHAPSCIWAMFFEDGSRRVIEAEYQSYFAYGTTNRPAGMRNIDVLEKVFGKSGIAGV